MPESRWVAGVTLGQRSNWIANFLRTLDRRAVAGLNAVYTISLYERKHFLSVYGVDPVVLYMGVDTSVFNNRAKGDLVRDALGLGDCPVVLLVSNLGSHKNIGTAISSMVYVKKAVPNAKMIIVGEGPERSKLQKHASDLGLCDSVSFLQPRPVGAELYAASDVFVHPAVDEPWGLAPLEAMACGVPVVVSEAVGMSEVVVEGKTGYIVPAHDTVAYAKAVTFLLRNSELRKAMGARAASYVTKRLAFERTLANVEKLYRMVIGGEQISSITSGTS
jgi:phosphatidylinositol alpha-1,6-mannosyltransferase